MDRLPDGVFGVLTLPGLILATVEDDWLDNQPRVSCIPAGTYILQRSWYHKGGYEAFEVVGVPNRSRILIHRGNVEEHIEGCIAVGLRRGKLRVLRDEDTGVESPIKEAVVESAAAYRRLMEALTGHDTASLQISWAEGLP